MPKLHARRILRERDELLFDDGMRIPIERVHDPRARHLRLIVSERGVRLTVPRWAAPTETALFLQRNEPWLRHQLARQSASQPSVSKLDANRTAELPLRGERLPLEWREGRFARLQREANGLVLQLPERFTATQPARLLREFYLAEARADVGRWLPSYLAGLPRAPSRWLIRPLSSLWGSLSASGSISLDLSLVLGRASAFEYVLVHELCHLIHANHSRSFWREVEARCPDWRGERDYLRGAGMGLKRELAVLLGE
jgi:predicted metal-dependent hydrolase